eukprot:13947773-Heterocapsa_arctica.AAC.1
MAKRVCSRTYRAIGSWSAESRVRLENRNATGAWSLRRCTWHSTGSRTSWARICSCKTSHGGKPRNMRSSLEHVAAPEL